MLLLPRIWDGVWRPSCYYVYFEKPDKKGTYIYYLLERGGECDFLVCNDNRVLQCVQVSYDISAEKTRKRELKGLKLAAQMTGCKNLLLLTDHDYEDATYEGLNIRIRPVHEWQ